MTKKNNTKNNSPNSITIAQILEGKDEDDLQFYRDILRYVIEKYKDKIKSETDNLKTKQELKDDNDDESSDTEFRVWDLSKWLLNNNRQLNNETKGSKDSTYTKTHSKIQNVSSSLNRLIELDLVYISREAKSLRNPTIPTKIYDVTPLGMLIASIVEFKTLTKGTRQYKEALKSLLRLWINFIPPGNKDWRNYNYHFLNGLVEKSLESHDDLLFSFIEFIRERTPDLIFNFGDLRYRANYVIFQKLIYDNNFRQLYFNWLNEFCRENPISTNTKEMIKFQFKLDVEVQYERSLSQLLNFSSLSIKTFQRGMKPNNKNLRSKKSMDSDYFDDINSEIVFDYNLKNQWEQMRINNLLNCDKITILVKCNKCGSIYPVQLEIMNEMEDLSDRIHKYGSMVKIYDLKNDTNALYLKRMLSTHTVI